MKHPKIKLIVVIISLTFLSAKCSTGPSVEDTEQCSPWLQIENHQVIPEESICNCRMYRYSSDYVGKTTYKNDKLVKLLKNDTHNDIQDSSDGMKIYSKSDLMKIVDQCNAEHKECIASEGQDCDSKLAKCLTTLPILKLIQKRLVACHLIVGWSAVTPPDETFAPYGIVSSWWEAMRLFLQKRSK